MHCVHLRPGSRVPFEARPLEAGVFLLGLFAASTRFAIEALKLSSADADTLDDPPFHTAAAGCVTLQVITNENTTWLCINNVLLCTSTN